MKEPDFQGYEDFESENDDWIYSYADMMTLILAFFVLLYSLSKDDDEKFKQMTELFNESFGTENIVEKTEEIVTGEEREQRALRMLVTMLNLGENLETAMNKIEKDYMEDSLSKSKNEETEDSNKLGKRISDEEASFSEITLPNSYLFESGKVKLSPKAERIVAHIAGKITESVNESSNPSNNRRIKHRVVITGHTDSSKLGPKSAFPNNFALSSARAGSIADLLIKNGIARDLIEVRGKGDLVPLYPEKDSNGRWISENMSKNRRVEISIRRYTN
ncbi:MAG: flagellar motor protein MotB [Pseudobacteriovorax sp.]|nr:flagellar motor protein MotB [Pseudobacteriovorax sp.]